MPANQIQFTGINRRITDYAQTGACEELINLRPTEAGLLPTKPHKTLFDDTDFLNMWTHNVGTDSLLIVSRRVGNDLIFSRLVESGEWIEICRFGAYDDVAVATLANILVFSDKTDLSCKAFRWNGTEYVQLSYEVNIPEIEVEWGTLQVYESKMPTWDEEADFMTVVQPGFDAIQKQNKDVCFGNVLLAFNVKCKDGEEFWTTRWVAPDLLPTLRTDGPNVDCDAWGDRPYVSTIDGKQYALTLAMFYNVANSKVFLAGAPLKVTLGQISSYDRESSMIEAINIYASKPKVCIDPKNYQYNSSTLSTLHVMLAQPEDLQKELLYFQKSVYMSELLVGDVEVNLEFGGDIQTTSATLNVDAGAVMRFGDMLSYNSRIHYYNSIAAVEATIPDISGGHTAHNVNLTTDVFGVYTLSTGTEKVLYLGQYTVPWGPSVSSVDTSARLICSDSRITRLFFRASAGICSVDMSASERYNYSYNFSAIIWPASSAVSSDLYALVDTAYTDYFSYEEPQDLNVSEQMNPFVFDVSHSYRFPGRILDVQIQLTEASDVAFGTHPLNVMTDDGVYALSQGNGEVLYGNITKVNDLVATGGSASTKQGVFVLAAGGLWLIAGRHSTLVSEALNGGPHKYLRSNSDYQALANDLTGNLYNVADYVSQPEFRDYVMGATLSFDQWEDDLIVSNRQYAYSYVLSLKHRQWFKISERVSQSKAGDKYAMREVSSTDGTAASQHCVASALVPADIKQFAKLTYYGDYENNESYTITTMKGETPMTGSWTYYTDTGQSSMLIYLLAAADMSSDTYFDGLNDDLIYAKSNDYQGSYIEITKTGDSSTVIASGAFSPISSPLSPGMAFSNGSYTIFCGTAAATVALPYGATRRENLARIVDILNEPIFPITAELFESDVDEKYDGFDFTAKQPGASGNNLTVSIRKQGANTVKFGPLAYGTDGIVISDIIDFSEAQLEYLQPDFNDDYGGEFGEGSDFLTYPRPTGQYIPVLVHLESRPMAPGSYMFTHVYRIVQLVRAALEGNDNLTVALYGSDDLQNWRLLTNAQRKNKVTSETPLQLSQIRSGMAGRSWRYFKFTVGGIVDSETDFGPLLMDYLVPGRRIG